MKIIKHGDKNVGKINFTCAFCGCKFESGKYYVSDANAMYREKPYEYKKDCPECGHVTTVDFSADEMRKLNAMWKEKVERKGK